MRSSRRRAAVHDRRSPLRVPMRRAALRAGQCRRGGDIDRADAGRRGISPRKAPAGCLRDRAGWLDDLGSQGKHATPADHRLRPVVRPAARSDPLRRGGRNLTASRCGRRYRAAPYSASWPCEAAVARRNTCKHCNGRCALGVSRWRKATIALRDASPKLTDFPGE
jgi:hypothetical protein